MPQLLCCPHGHQWTATDKNATACPICGSAGANTPSSKSNGTTSPQLDETLSLSGAPPANVSATLAPPKAPPQPPSAPKPAASAPSRAPGVSSGSALASGASSSAPSSQPPGVPHSQTIFTPDDSSAKSITNDPTLTDAPAKPSGAATGSPVNVGETLDLQREPITMRPDGPVPTEQVVVSGYEILGTLGRGGMGVVYKARQISLNRLTALKMILSGAHAGKEEIARFRTEAEAVAQLQHPNIVQIYEVGERSGLPFFSLEFVDGGSLQGKMTGTPMPPRAAAEMIAKLARAIHYAHQRGIIHRDIKPANILLTADGSPKITDFGLAKRLETEGGQTTTGSILGTPAYMAPEQASGKIHELGAASDTYSLGAMLYEMLAGRPPFRGETVIHTLQLVQTAEPLPPSRLQPRIPQDLETICIKCLQKEPHKRFATAQELADDLDRFLAGQPIKARRTPLWERGWKWARRHPSVAALLAILAIVLVGGFFGMFGLWLNAESERHLAEEARKDAVANETRAVAAAESETKAKKEAQGNYERASRILYATHMGLAQKALDDGYYGRALDLLKEEAARNAGGADLRGFEWFYLDRLAKADSLALMAHTNRVTQVAFSHDAKRLATASLDQKVKVWDIETGKVQLTLASHRRPVLCVVFSNDGKLIATASADGTVKIWDAWSGTELHTLTGHLDRVFTVAFSADGKLLASGSEDRTIILWDVATGKCLRTLKGHEYGVTSLAFNPTATMLASGGEDKHVLLWDLSGQKPPDVLQGHGHWVTCVGFDAQGKRLASGSLDETVIVWDVAKQALLRKLTDAKEPIRYAAFSPGGSQLAAQSSAGTLFVWDLTVKEPPKTLEAQPGLLRTLTFSGDGERLGAVEFDTRLWDLNVVLHGQTGEVTGVAFHPDGNLLASSGGYLDSATRECLGDIRLWDLAKRKTVRQFLGHTGPVRALAFTEGGKFLLSGSADASVRLWDVESGSASKVLEGHKGWVNAVACCPDGSLAASASEDETAIIWDLRGGKQPLVLTSHGRPVRAVAFSPDAKTLATGAADGSVKLWNVDTGKLLQTIPAHSFGVTSVTFSPNGRFLATAGEDQDIKIWNMTALAEPVHIFEGHTDTVTAIVYSPDGRRLISASADQMLKIWDTQTGEETLTLRGHTGGVSCVAMDREGRRLASGSWDETIRIWETSTQTPEKK